MVWPKGGPAGAYRRRVQRGAKAVASVQRKWRQSRAKQYAQKRKGLNKVEKTQVKTIIAKRKELKFCPHWFSYDDYSATGGFIQRRIPGVSVLDGIYNNSNNAVTCVGLQTGNYLNSASAAINAQFGAFTMYPMGGYGMERGDSAQKIDGDYAYLNSAKIDIQVACNVLENQATINNVSTPLEFRLIHVKAKKDQAGVTPSPLTELFLDETNIKEGLMMTGSVNEIMRLYPVNKNRFIKVKDFKFKLQNPIKPTALQTLPTATPSAQLADSTCSMPPSHPSTKDITLWLDKPKKKLRFSQGDDGTHNYYEPVNYDFIHYVFIIASRDTFYNSFLTNDNGTSQDSTGWTVSAHGKSTFRDC